MSPASFSAEDSARIRSASGTAAAGLLEAEIVTADGRVRVVNECVEPDLFWAMKGGGGGTFGVVTRLTLRTHELPTYFGGAGGKIKARSDAAFVQLIGRFIDFYSEKLFNPHWGRQFIFSRTTLSSSIWRARDSTVHRWLRSGVRSSIG